MKLTQQSFYQNIQNTFNKICQIEEFERAQKEEISLQMLNFWEYVRGKCLPLMRQIKQMVIIDRGSNVRLCPKKYDFGVDGVTYQEIALFFATEGMGENFFAEKRKWLDYALCAAYHPFAVFGEEINKNDDIFIKGNKFEEKNRIFLIAQKLQALEFILIAQKDINSRLLAVKKIFSDTEV